MCALVTFQHCCFFEACQAVNWQRNCRRSSCTLCLRNGLKITTVQQSKYFSYSGCWGRRKKKRRDQTKVCPWENKSIIWLFLLSRTSDLGVVGHADSADPIIGRRRHLACTSCSVPGERQEESQDACLKKKLFNLVNVVGLMIQHLVVYTYIHPQVVTMLDQAEDRDKTNTWQTAPWLWSL